jgi:hypothetical protein
MKVRCNGYNFTQCGLRRDCIHAVLHDADLGCSKLICGNTRKVVKCVKKRRRG